MIKGGLFVAFLGLRGYPVEAAKSYPDGIYFVAWGFYFPVLVGPADPGLKIHGTFKLGVVR